VHEFAEQTALATRKMYAAQNIRTSHRLVALDVPTPSWMRAPGECPGMLALESAVDELAIACRVDPLALRIASEPETGRPWSSRSLVEGEQPSGCDRPGPGEQPSGCDRPGPGEQPSGCARPARANSPAGATARPEKPILTRTSPGLPVASLARQWLSTPQRP
jgi:xanthine dehydrogenase YagR molybdenum-binding subunit